MGHALWLEKHNTVVIADLHLGIEQMFIERGVFLPKSQKNRIKEEIKHIIDQTHPETLIINGDLKHEFGKISRQEWKDTLEILDYIVGMVKKIVLVKGNHDTILEPISKKRGLDLCTHLVIDEFFICHGNKLFDNAALKKSKTIIIGHEHPAMILDDGIRMEKFKCFLVGKYKRKKLIVLPSFNPLFEGTDIEYESALSPYVKGKFKKYVIAKKEIYIFE